LLFISSRMQ